MWELVGLEALMALPIAAAFGGLVCFILTLRNRPRHAVAGTSGVGLSGLAAWAIVGAALALPGRDDIAGRLHSGERVGIHGRNHVR